MDDITKGLINLICSKEAINYKLAIEIVENLDIKYKYILLFIMKKQVPNACSLCNMTWNDEICNLWSISMDFNVKYKLTTDRIDNRHISFNHYDDKWMNEYIKDTKLYKLPHYIMDCCKERNSETQG